MACLDAKSGNVVWRKTPDNAPELFEAIGQYSNRQGAAWNWRTTCYLKCSDEALYFAGPQVDKLVAVSAKTGDVLWSYPYNNFQLILRDDGLYAISGQNDQGKLRRGVEAGKHGLRFGARVGDMHFKELIEHETQGVGDQRIVIDDQQAGLVYGYRHILFTP